MFNWPNLLTFTRMLAAPVFITFMFQKSYGAAVAAWGVFLFAALTDALDGYLARRLNCITDFGKVLDPIADKVVVVGALISFSSLGVVRAWVVLVIVARELLITGFRALASARGIQIYPTTLARWKTIFQMAAVGVILSRPVVRAGPVAAWEFAIGAILWSAVVLTVATGAWYLWKNRQVVISIFVR